MIKPTVGRVVWVQQRPSTIDALQPETAQICYVHSDTCVNVAGYDANDDPFKLTSLMLEQDESGARPSGRTYCEWMPYQKGQAAKVEQLEASIKDGFTKP